MYFYLAMVGFEPTPTDIYIYIYIYTPQPLYNTVRYNTVLDITRINVGPKLVILDLFSYITIHFTLVITWFG